jgi:hypothetical protein
MEGFDRVGIDQVVSIVLFGLQSPTEAPSRSGRAARCALPSLATLAQSSACVAVLPGAVGPFRSPTRKHFPRIAKPRWTTSARAGAVLASGASEGSEVAARAGRRPSRTVFRCREPPERASRRRQPAREGRAAQRSEQRRRLGRSEAGGTTKGAGRSAVPGRSKHWTERADASEGSAQRASRERSECDLERRAKRSLSVPGIPERPGAFGGTCQKITVFRRDPPQYSPSPACSTEASTSSQVDQLARAQSGSSPSARTNVFRKSLVVGSLG